MSKSSLMKRFLFIIGVSDFLGDNIKNMRDKNKPRENLVDEELEMVRRDAFRGKGEDTKIEHLQLRKDQYVNNEAIRCFEDSKDFNPDIPEMLRLMILNEDVTKNKDGLHYSERINKLTEYIATVFEMVRTRQRMQFDAKLSTGVSTYPKNTQTRLACEIQKSAKPFLETRDILEKIINNANDPRSFRDETRGYHKLMSEDDLVFYDAILEDEEDFDVNIFSLELLASFVTEGSGIWCQNNSANIYDIMQDFDRFYKESENILMILDHLAETNFNFTELKNNLPELFTECDKIQKQIEGYRKNDNLQKSYLIKSIQSLKMEIVNYLLQNNREIKITHANNCKSRYTRSGLDNKIFKATFPKIMIFTDRQDTDADRK